MQDLRNALHVHEVDDGTLKNYICIYVYIYLFQLTCQEGNYICIQDEEKISGPRNILKNISFIENCFRQKL